MKKARNISAKKLNCDKKKEYKLKNAYSPNPIIPPKEGIPIQNLNNPDEILLADLKCPICLNLIWKIVELNECGHTFCEFCIDKSIRLTGKFCPICKKTPITKRPNKTLIRFLNKIKIKCTNKQCSETPDYSDYLSHLEKCPFKLYHCTNEGCNYTDILSNIKNHVNNCRYRIIKCIYCSQNVKQYMLEEHEKKESNELIECEKCKKTMNKGEYYKKHFSEKNDNLQCLKDQSIYYQNKYNEILKECDNYKKEISNAQKIINELIDSNQKDNNNHEKEINKIKNEKEQLMKENEILKEKLLKWNNSFKNIYNDLVDKDKDEDEEIRRIEEEKRKRKEQLENIHEQQIENAKKTEQRKQEQKETNLEAEMNDIKTKNA